MIKSILLFAILLMGVNGTSQNVTATVALFDMLNELEEEMPEHWQIWDWSISKNKQMDDIPVVSLIINYREVGTKRTATGATVYIIEKSDAEKCDAYLEAHKNDYGNVDVVETNKSIVYILLGTSEQVDFDKWKKQLKSINKFLHSFFEERSSSF